MLPIIDTLPPENWENLHNMCLAIYLDGSCYEFALAIHRGTGWPMFGIMDGSVIRHVVVKGSDGKLRDARGIVRESKLGQPFGLKTPCTLKRVSEKDLRAVRPVSDFGIKQAEGLAEALWPK